MSPSPKALMRVAMLQRVLRASPWPLSPAARRASSRPVAALLPALLPALRRPALRRPALQAPPLVSSLAAPGGLDIFSSGAGITLAALSQAFASPGTMAAGWAHYVCFDLFVGRWVWADGLRNKVPARHSLVLGLFFGPLGLLTHLATRALVARGSLKDPVVDGLDDPMSDENLYSLIEDRR